MRLKTPAGQTPKAKGAEAPRSLTKDAQEVLLGWIREGKYLPGSQLPSVPDLVTRLSVSRTVVREALQALVGMNLVEMRPGSGCFVRSVPPELIVNAHAVAPLLDLDTLIEVAKARRAIEAGVSRLAAVAATDDDFEAMEMILFRIERLAGRNQLMHTLKPEFHIAIAHSTKNKILESIVAGFNALMSTASVVIERANPGQDYRISEYKAHRRLLDILKTRDPDAAFTEMDAHIGQTVRELEGLRRNGST